jgi:hypothetical protein
MNGPVACRLKKMARERAILHVDDVELESRIIAQHRRDWFLSAAGPSGLNLPIVPAA